MGKHLLLVGPRGADQYSATSNLKKYGHTVSYINEVAGPSTDARVRVAIKMTLLTEGLAVMAGWVDDPASRIAVAVAQSLTLPVLDVEEWFEQRTFVEEPLEVQYNVNGPRDGILPTGL